MTPVDILLITFPTATQGCSLSTSDQKTQRVWEELNYHCAPIAKEKPSLKDRLDVLKKQGDRVESSVSVESLNSVLPRGGTKRSFLDRSKHVRFQDEDPALKNFNEASSEVSVRSVSSIGDIPPINVCCNCTIS
ncbi:MAG: hypothetical protein JSS09_05595 [Verrucomicrobia bacterium]|nr:hypothetical protein [Verrucomicrobiota bacterium]